MDSESLQKQNTLLKIRDDNYQWLDPTRQGEKFLEYHRVNLDKKLSDISSDKFINDHNGYLLALGEIRVHRHALEAVDKANERASKAVKELEALEAANGES